MLEAGQWRITWSRNESPVLLAWVLRRQRRSAWRDMEFICLTVVLEGTTRIPIYLACLLEYCSGDVWDARDLDLLAFLYMEDPYEQVTDRAGASSCEALCVMIRFLLCCFLMNILLNVDGLQPNKASHVVYNSWNLKTHHVGSLGQP
jgi:hypothetical protein